MIKQIIGQGMTILKFSGKEEDLNFGWALAAVLKELKSTLDFTYGADENKPVWLELTFDTTKLDAFIDKLEDAGLLEVAR